MDCSLPGSSVHGTFPGKNTGVGPKDLPDPGINPGSPTLAGAFFTTEAPGKPRRRVQEC